MTYHTMLNSNEYIKVVFLFCYKNVQKIQIKNLASPIKLYIMISFHRIKLIYHHFHDVIFNNLFFNINH